jgi:hypothetical protein
MGSIMAPSMNTATAGVKPQDAGVAAALVSTMQQVGGSIGTAVLSTVTASVTTSYLASHNAGSAAGKIAATHGYVVAFVIGSALFAAGCLMGGTLFPSKAGLNAIQHRSDESPGTADELDGMLAEVNAVEV